MSSYPVDEAERRFTYCELREQVGSIFRCANMGHDDADVLASSLVEADLHGIHSHGVMRTAYPQPIRTLRWKDSSGQWVSTKASTWR